MATEDGTWVFVVDGQAYQLPRDLIFELWCALFLLVPLQLVAWQRRLS